MQCPSSCCIKALAVCKSTLSRLIHFCSDELGGRACLRRVFQRWREAAAEQASLGRLASAAAAALRSWLLRKWLGRWRQAVARSHLLAAREQQRAAALLQRAWTGWRQHWHDIQLARALDVAATLHRQQAASRHILHAWRAYAVALRQVELPPNHPTMAHAAELQRVRLQRTALLVGPFYLDLAWVLQMSGES